jgi:hypothetical protein
MTTRADILDYDAGNSLEIDFTCVDSAGDAISLSGATVRWSIFRLGGQQSECDRYLTLTSADDEEIDITDAAAGELTVFIADGAFKKAGEFTHELEVLTSAGERLSMARGRFRSRGSAFAEDDSCNDSWRHGCDC